MSDSLVTTERRDGVLICHLDDGKANALSNAMISEISAALTEAEGDDDLSALVLHGRKGKFSAGFDLGVMLGDNADAATDLVANGGELVRSMYGSTVPIVAACTGHALAAGALMLLGCDVRIGSDRDCKIGLNEVAIGMTLPDWALTLARDRMTPRHLQRALATARVTAGAGAVEAGYLDEVVADADVLDAAVAQATELAALDRWAYSVTAHKLRSGVIDQMATEIASDRAGGAATR